MAVNDVFQDCWHMKFRDTQLSEQDWARCYEYVPGKGLYFSKSAFCTLVMNYIKVTTNNKRFTCKTKIRDFLIDKMGMKKEERHFLHKSKRKTELPLDRYPEYKDTPKTRCWLFKWDAWKRAMIKNYTKEVEMPIWYHMDNKVRPDLEETRPYEDFKTKHLGFLQKSNEYHFRR